MTVSTLLMTTPVGHLELVSEDHTLTAAHFLDDVSAAEHDSSSDEPVLLETRRQLTAYFEGRLRSFDLPLALHGSEFQQRVWDQLRAIPFGVTTSYGEIASRLGMPKGASRAVGLANGANPIAIVVPCHRVIGSNGKLVGYAAGLERKRLLLALEAPVVQEGLFAG
jgi:methylated-DNA-[protein]-cysteine S-methyltransferase